MDELMLRWGLLVMALGVLGCDATLPRYRCFSDDGCAATHRCEAERCVPREMASSSSAASSSSSSAASSSVAASSSAAASSSTATSSSGGAPSGLHLVVDGSGGSATITQELAPVTFRLLDDEDAPVPGVAVTVAGPAGSVVTPSSGTSDDEGSVTVTLRLGRAMGMQEFTATAPDATPTTYAKNALPPAFGHVITLVNVDRGDDETGIPGAGLAAHVRDPVGLAVRASDGSVFFSQSDRVLRLLADGALVVTAGGGTDLQGDGGPATEAALLDPRGLALSADGTTLFIAESGNQRVRAVDLEAGTITTVAGGGSEPDGDGIPATLASLQTPTELSLGADGDLYISDVGTSRIWRVDLEGGTIHAWLSATTEADCTAVALAFRGCPAPPGCQVVWDSDDNAYFGATACGTSIAPDGASIPVIFQRTPAGALSRYAGSVAGTFDDDVMATSALLGGAPALGMDGADNLLVAAPDSHRIRRIDAVTRRISTIAGNGTAGDSGDFSGASGARINAPYNVVVSAGHVYFTDHGNHAIRVIW